MKKNKKSNSKKKTKKPEKKEETKLEEEIKQAEKAIMHRLRETLNDKEKEIEEEVFEEPVREIPISEIKAPVLERIIERQIPIQNQFEVQQPEETRERRIDYSPASNEPNYGFARNTAEEEEKKYETTFIPPVLTRREIAEREIRHEFLKPPVEDWSRVNESQLSEIDFVEDEIKLPFEEQKKYKRHKLR